MAEAPRDENRVTSLLGVSNADGTTTIPLYADAATNRLLVSGVGGGGTSSVDDAAFVAGSGAGTPVMGFATADAVDAGDVGVLAMDVNRNLKVAVQSGGGGTEYATQTAYAAGHVGSPSLVVRNDVVADLAGVDGDYTVIQVNATGEAYVVDEAGNTLLGTIDADTSTLAGAVAAGQMQVDIVADGAGLATTAKQLADGHNVTIDNISTDEVFVRGSQAAGSPVDNEVVTVQGIASMTALSVTESSPISGFATSAKQLADGHNVTIDNGAAGSAVNIQDGGNTITVDGTIALTNDSIVGAGDPTIDSYTQLAINLDAGANQLLVSSAANKQIWVYGVSFTLSVAGTVSFQDESDTAITGIMDFAANSGMSHPTSGNFAMPIWKLDTDKDLEVDVVTAAIDGWLNYAIVSV